MQYIYRIHCVDDNKDYVGLTNNPKRRENRHWNDLKNHQHDNPKLQNAFNKYGRKSFYYEILQAYDCSEEEIKKHEQEWIIKLDSYQNGYNCNPGGDLSYNPGKLSKQEVFEILSVTDKMDHKGAQLATIYGVSIKVISNVRAHHSYNIYIDEYNQLPQSEKDRLFVIMNSIHHFKKEINKNRRKYTRDQVYMIYIQRDYKLPFTLRSIAENFGMDISKTPFSIKDGTIYKDYFEDYKKLNIEDKNKVLCDYIEKYNMNPFELLETPNA